MMVGAEGFEPPTLCSQSRCATRLRYAPTLAIVFGGGATEADHLPLRRCTFAVGLLPVLRIGEPAERAADCSRSKPECGTHFGG